MRLEEGSRYLTKCGAVTAALRLISSGYAAKVRGETKSWDSVGNCDQNEMYNIVSPLKPTELPPPPPGKAVGANSIQHGGDHYKKKSIQPWDYVAVNNLGFFEGNAIKYITRHKDKNGVEDLKKAIHYLEKLIELEQQNVS